MTKIEFLAKLAEKLQALPEKERKESLEYYAEIIDDHTDDGMTEEEAVAACGDINKIVDQIIVDTPLTKLVKQKTKTRRKMRSWEIILLIAGFPVWVPLLAAFFCVLLALSVSLWAIVVSFYATTVALGVSGIGLCAVTVIVLVQGQFLNAAVNLGAGLVLAGLAILFFLLSNQLAKGVVWLHKITFRAIKRCFIRKEKTI